MISKRIINYIFISIIVLIVILSAFLFAIYLPNINIDSSSEFNTAYDKNSSIIDKHVVYISKDLSDNSEYKSAMQFKSMFNAYNNIAFSIYDSQGKADKQKSYLDDILGSEVDVVILNSIDHLKLLPTIIKLNESSISIIAIGNHTVSPYYSSIGYSPAFTGKLIVLDILNKISSGSISFMMESNEYKHSTELINAISTEVSKNDNLILESNLDAMQDSNTDFINNFNLTDQDNAVLVLDSASFTKTYDILLSNDYKGYIYVVTQSSDNFAYILENPKVSFIYQDAELFNEQLFDTLLGVFNYHSEKPHIEAKQFIVNSDNIDRYIY